jgi:hypothetical protein
MPAWLGYSQLGSHRLGHVGWFLWRFSLGGQLYLGVAGLFDRRRNGKFRHPGLCLRHGWQLVVGMGEPSPSRGITPDIASPLSEPTASRPVASCYELPHRRCERVVGYITVRSRLYVS